MIYLITGGTGFIGANIIHRLVKLNRKDQFHLIVRSRNSAWRLSSIQDKLIFHQVDLLDSKAVLALVKKIQADYIFHCATYGMFMAKQKDLDLMIQTNIVASKNLLGAALTGNCQKFINLGSSSEYGLKDQAMKETDFLEPNNMYAATKASGTLICSQLAREKNFPLLTFRLFSPYGPWEDPGRLIPTLMRHKLEGGQANLSSPSSIRDFIYIDDVVDMLILALRKASKAGDIFNLGTGKESTIQELVKMLKLKVNWQQRAAVQSEPKHWQADMTYTYKTFAQLPTTSLSLGLKKTFNWFKQHSNYYQMEEKYESN